jgi:stress response protein SCP2
MLAAHEQFIPSAKDRVTVLRLGKSLPEEALDLYHSLAGSSVPLNDSDREVLTQLAEVCLSDPQPDSIPVRENRAVINLVRVNNERVPIVDTPTDILRLACALSSGDLTLAEKTKFKSFPRKVRSLLMAALDSVIEIQPAKLADINQYREPWKRLGERLHPHEYPRLKYAQDVFAVARRDKRAQSLAAKVEVAFAGGNVQQAIALLAVAPGMLFRSLDRILRTASAQDADALFETLPEVITKVSGRVIMSAREHFQNRLIEWETPHRVFANSKGKAWVTPDARTPLSQDLVEKLFDIFDAELLRRLPDIEHLVVNREVLGLALPLSDKNKSGGFAIMPRGSALPVADGILRFFVYWKQKSERTDYDLSVLMLNEKFEYVNQLSWTNLRTDDGVGVHSGDITSAPDGSSEFIDIHLGRAECKYVVPQVNVFAGESFPEVGECFFGFMERAPEQKGKPFEAAAVRTKSEMRGKGRVALPLVFVRDDEGKWSVKWMHLYLNGWPNFNRVEANRLSAALLARSIVNRSYLSVEYIMWLLKHKVETVSWYEGQELAEPVSYLGLDAPEGLPAGSTVVTLSNLNDLIPV